VFTRTDPRIDYAWGTGTPANGVPPDNFSIRWTGSFVPTTTETYTFSTKSDDGVRLWVNGILLVDHWTNHGVKTDSAKIKLTAGQRYSLKMEYYDHTKDATAQLLMSTPSLSLRFVPHSLLYTQ
jgi:hypothetical protein